MLFTLTKALLLTFVIVAASLGILEGFSQDMPSIACPEKFEYVRADNSYTGKITVYGALVPSIKVETLFSQQEPITTSYKGRLTLIESLQRTEANLLNGKAITYRVDFPDPQLLPKLIRLRVNNRTICADYELPTPSAIFTLHHTFYPSYGTVSRPTPPTHLINPFNNRKSINSLNTTTNDEANCGQEDPNLNSSIVSGNYLERGHFPWLTAIFIRYSNELKYRCAGSLISTRTVITAALCFHDAQIEADRIVVYLGRHNLTLLEIGVERRDIQTLIKHPQFNRSVPSDADIALLLMKTPVSFTQFIRPICLWSSSAGVSHKVAYVASWDSKYAHDLDNASLPKVFQVDIAGEVECLRSRSNFLYFTTPRTLCAGKRDGTGLCFGALGAGLMVNHAGNIVLRAMFSLAVSDSEDGNVTCNLREYFVYCDLANHVTWVRHNML